LASKAAAVKGWRVELEEWALAYAQRLSRGVGAAGVLIGGSIARGDQWEHSDLEVAVLVEKVDPALPHFSVDCGRGIEIFQLEKRQLEEEASAVEGGDLGAVASWPPQLYRSRITHDPSGLLARFVAAFDRHLFSDAVRGLKLDAHQKARAAALREARVLLADGRPCAALAMARAAMNEHILTLHWALGELPRSQNRSDTRLRALTNRHGLTAFYALFRDVFDLDSTDTAIRNDWPNVREQVLGLAELWEGESSRAFFAVAVDSDFAWGEDGGILCAYRLYTPLFGLPDAGAANTSLLRFLGLASADEPAVAALLARVASSAAPGWDDLATLTGGELLPGGDSLRWWRRCATSTATWPRSKRSLPSFGGGDAHSLGKLAESQFTGRSACPRIAIRWRS
jgi:hypothetical protein